MTDIKDSGKILKDTHSGIPKYPEIQRDFGVVHSKEKSFILGLAEKTEKLLVATVLVTDIFTPSILGDRLRESIITAHKSLFGILADDGNSRFRLYENACVALLEYLSILRTLFVSGFVGKMNYDLLVKEVTILEKTIEQAFITPTGEYVSGNPKDTSTPLSKDMFSSDGFERGRVLYHREISKPITRLAHQGQNDVRDVFYKKTDSKPFNRQDDDINTPSKTVTDNQRQIYKTSFSVKERKENIINILRFNGKSDTQTLIRLLPGMNQKMLQRDLNLLIDEGAVSRTGVKRWSVYSLKV